MLGGLGMSPRKVYIVLIENALCQLLCGMDTIIMDVGNKKDSQKQSANQHQGSHRNTFYKY